MRPGAAGGKKQMTSDRKNQPALDEARRRIDALDERIQALISERATLASEVGASKGELPHAVDYYRPEREAQVLRGVLERNEGPLSDSEMLRLFREIMSACLARQEPLKSAYLGPEGTFAQQAVYRHFGHSVQALGHPAIETVFEQVQGEEADFGVVPIENSTQGIVTHTLDMFLESDLKICGEVEMRIHHNLLTHSESLGGLERVYAHQQSLSQCRAWLRRNLPGVETISVASNAEAARRVRNSPDAAAIASRSAAEIYGVPMLFTRIEDNPDNTTRFLVIGRALFDASGDDKTTLLLAGKEGPGLLHQLLEPLARHSVNMTRIESRPARTGNWRYVFFVDIDGHADDGDVSEALKALREISAETRVLGSYPRAVLSPAEKSLTGSEAQWEGDQPIRKVFLPLWRLPACGGWNPICRESPSPNWRASTASATSSSWPPTKTRSARARLRSRPCATASMNWRCTLTAAVSSSSRLSVYGTGLILPASRWATAPTMCSYCWPKRS
jgi:chorismate mutase/prephenate dehydratase